MRCSPAEGNGSLAPSRAVRSRSETCTQLAPPLLLAAGLAILAISTLTPYAYAGERSITLLESGQAGVVTTLALVVAALYLGAHKRSLFRLSKGLALLSLILDSYFALIAHQNIPEQIAVMFGLDGAPGIAVPLALAGLALSNGAVLGVRRRR